MKIESIILANEDILGLLSKTESNFYCVFIQPNGIVNPSRTIECLNLNCEEGSLVAEDLMLEIYDDKSEAKNRVIQFKNEWEKYFYVSCYRNGKFHYENT